MDELVTWRLRKLFYKLDRTHCSYGLVRPMGLLLLLPAFAVPIELLLLVGFLVLGLLTHLVNRKGHRVRVWEQTSSDGWLGTRGLKSSEGVSIRKAAIASPYSSIVVDVGLRRVVAKVYLVLKVRRMHHVLVRPDNVAGVLLVVVHGLLPAREGSEGSSVFTAILGTNDLNVAVAPQKFHVRRTVKEDFARDRRQRVRQVAQLFGTMGEAAVVLELAHAGLLKVAADLCFVIGVHGSDVVMAWVVDWHRL